MKPLRERATHDARIEVLRVLAAGSVFVYHFIGDAQRILDPSWRDSPLWRAAMEWTGPWGVGMFIVIAGTVGAWSIRRKGCGGTQALGQRLSALFLPYWWVAIPLIAAGLVTRDLTATELWKVPFWLSGTAIASPSTFFPLVDAWWYMTLALQMALALPLVWWLTERVHPITMILGSAVVATATCALVAHTPYAYMALGLLPARLFEFASGVVLGRTALEHHRMTVGAANAAALVAGSTIMVAADPGLAGPRVAAVLALALALSVVDHVPSMMSRTAIAGGAITYTFFLSHSPWAGPVLGFAAARLSDVEASIASAFVSFTIALVVALGFSATYACARRAMGRLRLADS